MRYIKHIGFMLLIISSIVQAQSLTNFSINTAYDNNPFRLPESQESWVSNFNIGVQHNFSSFSVSYLGGYTHFDQITDRNFYWHQLALFGTNGATNWGLYADQRLNGDDYKLYNYTIYTAYLNHHTALLGLNLFLDGHFNINTYANLPEIDNFEVSSALRINKSFSTRTTLIAGGKILFKRYINSTEAVTEVIEDGSGGGRGMQTGGGSFLVYSEIEAPSATQLLTYIRIAQSVTTSTGIAIQTQKQIMLSGSSRFVSGLSNGYSEESQLFDDPIGYESEGIGSEFTQLLMAGFYLKGAYYITQKRYETQGIYLDAELYESSELREDTYKIGWLRLQKIIPIHFPAEGSLTLRLVYQWTDNSSNSFWYNYANQYSALEIEFQF
jgi:hypothetical protein